MKERDPSQQWGLIAPISVDPASRIDRLRVLETVQAYCIEHSLQFAALILLPPTYAPQELITSHSVGTSNAVYCTQCTLSLAGESIWEDSVTRELTETVHMIQDCVKLLKKFHARVIIVSGCSVGRFPGKLAPKIMLCTIN